MNYLQTFLSFSSSTGEWISKVGPGAINVLKAIMSFFVLALEWIVGAIKWGLSFL